jgi:hypothetical protein
VFKLKSTINRTKKCELREKIQNFSETILKITKILEDFGGARWIELNGAIMFLVKGRFELKNVGFISEKKFLIKN